MYVGIFRNDYEVFCTISIRAVTFARHLSVEWGGNYLADSC